MPRVGTFGFDFDAFDAVFLVCFEVEITFFAIFDIPPLVSGIVSEVLVVAIAFSDFLARLEGFAGV